MNVFNIILTITGLPDFSEYWWVLATGTVLLIIFQVLLSRAVKRARRDSERKLEQVKQEKAAEIEAAANRFLSTIVRDLLPPVNAIAELTQDSDDTPRTALLHANAIRLQQLVRNLADFRHAEQLELHVSQTDLVAFVKSSSQNHFDRLKQQQHVQFAFTSLLNSMTAWFDTEKIDRLIAQLLTELLKHAAENSRLSVSVAMKYEGLAAIKFACSRSGITNRQLKTLFDPANAGDNIGLTVAKRIAESHHGTVTTASASGDELSIIVELACKESDYTANEIERTAPPEPQKNIEQKPVITAKTPPREPEYAAPTIMLPPPPVPSKYPARILLAIPSADRQNPLKAKLSELYFVYTAAAGLQALATVRDADADVNVVVSDSAMPEMSGLELCRNIKKDLTVSHIHVMLLTAKNSIEDRLACLEAGVDSYIPHPVDVNELLNRLATILTQKKNRQQEFRTNAEAGVLTLDFPDADSRFLDEAIKNIDKNLTQSEFNLDMMAADINMPKAALQRKIKDMTGMDASDLVRNIKLKRACRLLLRNTSVSEIADSLGFANTRYFASAFKDEFGLTPTEFHKTKKF
ncbi:MAG: helix-turn-helix domain-containing protein [Bacteroidales bacterium]|nr:helix-turn-helix domain-containing protein [Bacteroidales bacterium]